MGYEAFDKVETLFQWAVENTILKDPKRIPNLYSESRRRWAPLMSRHKISELIEKTLRKIKQKGCV